MNLFDSLAEPLQLGGESRADDVVSSAPFALEFGAPVFRGAVQQSLFNLAPCPQLAQASATAESPAPVLALSAPEPLPVVAPKVPRVDARRQEYSGPFPRKRHYHKCPKCVERGSHGVGCYMKKCTRPVLMDTPCGFCGGPPRPRG